MRGTRGYDFRWCLDAFGGVELAVVHGHGVICEAVIDFDEAVVEADIFPRVSTMGLDGSGYDRVNADDGGSKTGVAAFEFFD